MLIPKLLKTRTIYIEPFFGIPITYRPLTPVHPKSLDYIPSIGTMPHEGLASDEPTLRFQYLPFLKHAAVIFSVILTPRGKKWLSRREKELAELKVKGGRQRCETKNKRQRPGSTMAGPVSMFIATRLTLQVLDQKCIMNSHDIWICP